MSCNIFYDDNANLHTFYHLVRVFGAILLMVLDVVVVVFYGGWIIFQALVVHLSLKFLSICKTFCICFWPLAVAQLIPLKLDLYLDIQLWMSIVRQVKVVLVCVLRRLRIKSDDCDSGRGQNS